MLGSGDFFFLLLKDQMMDIICKAMYKLMGLSSFNKPILDVGQR